MGLDAVELAMRVEDEFDISIPDEYYGQFSTVGDLYAYIDQQHQVESLCLNPAAFVRIRRALMSLFALPRNQIRPATDLNDLFPISDRRQQWAQFEATLGLRTPKLDHSVIQRQQAAAALMGLVVVLALLCLLTFLDPVFLTIALLAPILASIAMLLMGDRFARTFPMPDATVGALTHSVASLNPIQLSDEISCTTTYDHEYWARLRRVVSQTLSIPEEEISPHSRFVEDLLVD